MAKERDPEAPHLPEVRGEWSTEEAWWRDNLRSRPFARPDRDFQHYRGALRYGWEGAREHPDTVGWGDVESDMMHGWQHSPHRDSDFSAWEEMKDAIRDAWERVRGEPRVPHSTR